VCISREISTFVAARAQLSGSPRGRVLPSVLASVVGWHCESAVYWFGECTRAGSRRGPRGGFASCGQGDASAAAVCRQLDRLLRQRRRRLRHVESGPLHGNFSRSVRRTFFNHDNWRPRLVRCRRRRVRLSVHRVAAQFRRRRSRRLRLHESQRHVSGFGDRLWRYRKGTIRLGGRRPHWVFGHAIGADLCERRLHPIALRSGELLGALYSAAGHCKWQQYPGEYLSRLVHWRGYRTRSGMVSGPVLAQRISLCELQLSRSADRARSFFRTRRCCSRGQAGANGFDRTRL